MSKISIEEYGAKKYTDSYEGIPTFVDLSPIIEDYISYDSVIGEFIKLIPEDCTGIAGLSSRGYWFSCPLAMDLLLPMISVRKAGKVPEHPTEYVLITQLDTLKTVLL